MIICPDCCLQVLELGKPCLFLLMECLDYFEEDILIAFDTRHLRWKLKKSGYRLSKDLEHSLALLEKRGYLISSEISEHLIGITVNWENTEYDDLNDVVCWCTKQRLE